MSSSGKKWDVNQLLTFIGVILALLGLIVAVIAVVVTITTPELRSFFGLKESNTPVPQPKLKTIPQKIEKPPVKQAAVSKPPVIHKAKEPAGPQECIIGENKSQRIEEAKTDLSIIFNEEYKIVTLTISPDGKEQITLPTVGIGSKEFASSTGVFLVHILNVDWDSRTIMVQVSRKSS